MSRRNELYSRMKELTGYSYQNIADEFEVSKQHVHQCFSNHSMVYENSTKFMILRMVNKKIDEHKVEIEKLKKLKEEFLK